MALMITDDCVSCGVFEPECPTHSITEGDDVGDIYSINLETCTECEGNYDEPHCAEVCPVDCCIPAEMAVSS